MSRHASGPGRVVTLWPEHLHSVEDIAYHAKVSGRDAEPVPVVIVRHNKHPMLLLASGQQTLARAAARKGTKNQAVKCRLYNGTMGDALIYARTGELPA